MPSRTMARASMRSREPGASPPTTSTRHWAPIAAASSTARRLSSSARSRPARSKLVNMPPRHRPVTVSPLARIACAASATPIAWSWSRHGEMPGMPARAMPSIAWRKSHCARTVAVLIERKRVPRVRSRITRQGLYAVASRVDPVHAEHGAHAGESEVGIGEQAGGIGEAEKLGQMGQRARALLAADHGEVALMAVEIGHEHDAGIVEARRRLEDVARQLHRRRQDVVE